MKQDYLSQPNSSRKRITKTIFMRCFDLKTLPNRGGTFSNGQRQSPISLVNTCNIIVQLVNLVYTCQQIEGGSVKTCPKVQGTMADRQGFTDLRELCWLVDRFNFSNRVLGQFSLGLIVCREELQRPHRQRRKLTRDFRLDYRQAPSHVTRCYRQQRLTGSQSRCCSH